MKASLTESVTDKHSSNSESVNSIGDKKSGQETGNNASNNVYVGACYTDKQLNPDAIDLPELETDKVNAHQSKSFKVQIDKTANKKNKVQEVTHESHLVGENIANNSIESGECNVDEAEHQYSTGNEENNNQNYEGAEEYYNQDGANNAYYQVLSI
jgi:hypothetical protein